MWSEPADVLHASYARSVEAVGGLPVLLPPITVNIDDAAAVAEAKVDRGSPPGGLGPGPLELTPGAQDLVVSRAYKLFPEGGPEQPPPETPEQRAFVRATRGVHW